VALRITAVVFKAATKEKLIIYFKSINVTLMKMRASNEHVSNTRTMMHFMVPRSVRLKRAACESVAALAFLAVICAAGRSDAGFLGAPADEGYLSLVINRALEVERTLTEVPWVNPATGNRGVIVIDRTFYRDADRPCRNYHRTIEGGDGVQKVVRGTGCRIGPGLWSISETSGDSPSAETRARSAPKMGGRAQSGELLRQSEPASPAGHGRRDTEIQRPKPKPEMPAVTEGQEENAIARGKDEMRADRPVFPKYTVPKETEL